VVDVAAAGVANVTADGMGNVAADGMAEVDADGVPGIAADEVSGVAADEISGVAANEVPGVAADEVPGIAADGAPGVLADKAPGVTADEVPGVAADEVDASVDIWLDPPCFLFLRQKLENGSMVTGKNPTIAVMVERMRKVLPALICQRRHSWDWTMLGRETRHSSMANLIPWPVLLTGSINLDDVEQDGAR
jgi:hypothetical protein